jgi:Chaperone of endosialidase
MNAKDIKGFLVGAIVVASSISVLAVTIPNSFSAGTPIKASDVNANFSAINTALENHDHFGQTWSGDTGIGLAVRTKTGNMALFGNNLESQDGYGVAGLARGSKGAGVFGNNPNGVGVWGASLNGNGGYFETTSSSFPSLALRQFGSNNIIDAYGPGDSVPEFSLDKDGNGVFRGKVTSRTGLSADNNDGPAISARNNSASCTICASQAGSGDIIRGFGPGSNFPKFYVLANGDVISVGQFSGQGFNNTSDRNAKKNFSNIDAQNVLEKITAMPITRWNYKTDASSVAHVGPMAQDFHAAFGLNGTDDKHISSIDAQGVALAAIQGLNQKLETENAKLRSSLTDLEKRLVALERK